MHKGNAIIAAMFTGNELQKRFRKNSYVTIEKAQFQSILEVKYSQS